MEVFTRLMLGGGLMALSLMKACSSLAFQWDPLFNSGTLQGVYISFWIIRTESHARAFSIRCSAYEGIHRLWAIPGAQPPFFYVTARLEWYLTKICSGYQHSPGLGAWPSQK